MSSSPFFSIVVSCCNVELYVEACLSSLLKQSFEDWECLISIETSDDRTEELILEKVSADSRFIVLTGPRTGSCSVGRNTGIDEAEGRYLVFLDGDDTLLEDCLERLHSKICDNPDADLYPGIIYVYNEFNQSRYSDCNYLPDAREMNGIEATLYLDRQWHGRFCPMLQMTIFRREYLTDNFFKCIPGIRCQDAEFSPRVLFLAKRIVPLHEPFYLYRRRVNSIQSKAKGIDYFYPDWTIITCSLLDFYREHSRSESFDRRVAQCWFRQWIPRVFQILFSPEAIKKVPRQNRVEMLACILEKSAGPLRDMLIDAPFQQRVAFFFVFSYLNHPFARAWIDHFFILCFRLKEMNLKLFHQPQNRRRTGRFLIAPSE